MVSINNLPNEIIIIILEYNSCTEIVNFGSTCKRFHEIINANQALWKSKMLELLSPDLYGVVESHCKGDWYSEAKMFTSVRLKLYKEIVAMSPKLYWQTEVTYEDMRGFFSIALTNNMTYYYALCVLQEFVRKCRKYVNEQKCIKPYTLTESYYAKTALRYLFHTYLAIKWVREHIKENLHPENVINFFIQWVDTDAMHLDESVEMKISEVVQMIESHLQQSRPPKKSKEPLTEIEKLQAISHVLYKQRHMTMTTAANLDTLNIVRVLHTNCGNAIVLAAIYHCIAKRLGVYCEFVIYPNHLFVEWRDTSNHPRLPIPHIIDLATGEIRPKRLCPYQQAHGILPTYIYYPDMLLQYIYSAFHRHLGALTNWNSQNAQHLLDFLGTHDNNYNPYRQFLPYLVDAVNLSKMEEPLNIRHLDNAHLQLMVSLTALNAPIQVYNKPFLVKKRDSPLKFAIGMICYHKKYEYTCIIWGWDLDCTIEWQRRMEIDALDFGPKQPFYHVIAVDQSQRYVAQENLVEKKGVVSRLFYLEDFISREFTHFDGFAYVPNEQKKLEYPEDAPIVNFYRSRLK